MLKASYFTPTELAMFQENNAIFNPSQMKIVNRKTPESEIEIKKDSSGREFKSVKAAYMKALVALVTGGNYDFEIKEQVFLSTAGEIRTTARLIIRTNGNTIVREQVGKSECKIPNANSFKASASDAFKKCASEFGFCWDIYGQETTKEAEPEMTHEEAVILQRLIEIISNCKTADDVEFTYNEYLQTAKETTASKAVLEEHMKRVMKLE